MQYAVFVQNIAYIKLYIKKQPPDATAFRIFSIRRCSSYRCHRRTTVKPCYFLPPHSLTPLQSSVFHFRNLRFPLGTFCSLLHSKNTYICSFRKNLD